MKIAVVGAGISGLGCALTLDKAGHDVTLIEANEKSGGHANSVVIHVDDMPVNVDTGFIVYNEKNYPHLTKMFDYLDVETAPSNMSFGISENDGNYEYCTENIFGVFAQLLNLVRPSHWSMLRDIPRFNKASSTALANGIASSVTLGEYLDNLGMSEYFRTRYLLPMGAAIWSTPVRDMLNYPAASFLRFFDNHGLLTVNDQPEWRTVCGGSRRYVNAVIRSFSGQVVVNSEVTKAVRHDKGVTLHWHDAVADFDHVVMACHADQSLAIIEDLTKKEKDWLGAFTYRPNKAVLHRDISLMPKRRPAWAAWNVLTTDDEAHNPKNVSLTYWMNHLQPLATHAPVFVTLNPIHEPDPDLVWGSYDYAHPQFTAASIAAQAEQDNMQGHGNLWYAGAWLRYGFHEDGLASGIKVAESIGAPALWSV